MNELIESYVSLSEKASDYYRAADQLDDIYINFSGLDDNKERVEAIKKIREAREIFLKISGEACERMEDVGEEIEETTSELEGWLFDELEGYKSGHLMSISEAVNGEVIIERVINKLRSLKEGAK